FSSRRRHTRFSRDWSSDVCSSDLLGPDARTKVAKRQSPGLVGRLDGKIQQGTKVTHSDRRVDVRVAAPKLSQRPRQTRPRSPFRSEERRVGKGCSSQEAQSP